MRKKVLIISSDNTGHGHKSITESLIEKVSTYHAEIHVVDGFSLGGPRVGMAGDYILHDKVVGCGHHGLVIDPKTGKLDLVVDEY